MRTRRTRRTTTSEDAVQLLDILGAGSQGVVRRALLHGQKRVAVKSVFLGETDALLAAREIKLLALLDHENIVQCLGIILYSAKEIGIVEELMDTDLSKCMTMIASVERKRHIALCVARAMAHLHDFEPPLLHRDLKPGNILLSTDGEQVKLCDFGVAKLQQTIMTKDVGTITYIAPQVWMSEQYDASCDVYSFGVCMIELYLGSPGAYTQMPNDGHTTVLAWVQRVEQRLVVPKEVPGVTWIAGCVAWEPDERPSFADLLQVI